MSSITPSRKHSTSIAPLCVSTTATTSPGRTRLPAATRHSTSLPVSMSAPRAGIVKSAMGQPGRFISARATATISSVRGSAAVSICMA